MNSSQSPSHQPEYLYSVLNLPVSASQNEIRERYRALSVIFHPDKQQNANTKDTAAKTFLEIQKAYEVLSDPFLREVYNILGEEGLTLKWSPELRSLPADELRDKLDGVTLDWKRRNLESLINPRGRVTYGVDATSLFSKQVYPWDSPWYENLLDRFLNIRLSTFSLRHSVERQINDKTGLTLAARMSRGSEGDRLPGGNFFGTIRHQYSPRIAFEGTFTMLRPRALGFKASYSNNDTSFSVQSHISPGIQLLPPPLTVSLSRRLYRDSPTTGVVEIHTGLLPVVAVTVVSPAPFDLSAESHHTPVEDDDESGTSKIGSVSGLNTGTRYWSYGATVAGLASSLKAEWGVTFTELRLQLKLGLELGLTGLAWLLTGSWAPSETSEVSASVGLSAQGVLMRLEVLYIAQRLSIPIVLSQHYDAALALCTAVVPSTAFVIGYHFILKPRRRAQRAAYFRVARRALDEEKSNLPRESVELTSVLKETAKKHTDVEGAKGGLVILEASYGPNEPDGEAKALMVDVTIPMQALVHNSQLHIPGYRTKTGVQGFYDPAPDISKALRVRYLFRGRAHYAEIPDHLPVVLPLADHLAANQ